VRSTGRAANAPIRTVVRAELSVLRTSDRSSCNACHEFFDRQRAAAGRRAGRATEQHDAAFHALHAILGLDGERRIDVAEIDDARDADFAVRHWFEGRGVDWHDAQPGRLGIHAALAATLARE